MVENGDRNLDLPEDVVSWVRQVFRECNEQTSALMTQIPNVHEGALDHAFIYQFSRFFAPHRVPSDWVVTIETHFLGGRRYFEGWEIADVGLLVFFRKGGKVLRSKVGLLQSKRLYPNEQAYTEDTIEDYMSGFGRLFRPDDDPKSVFGDRLFTFNEGSKYKAFRIGAKQEENIGAYVDWSGIPAYYLLYNPWQVPWSVTVPISDGGRLPADCTAGCRVVPSHLLHDAFKGRPEGSSPTYANVVNAIPDAFEPSQHPGGWTLEHFGATLLLKCREGYHTDEGLDARFRELFGGRTQAIAAALSITIDAP